MKQRKRALIFIRALFLKGFEESNSLFQKIGTVRVRLPFGYKLMVQDNFYGSMNALLKNYCFPIKEL